MTSRLLRAASGKPVGVEVTMPSVGLDHGVRFTVLGDEIRRPGNKFAFTGWSDARPPTPEEAQGALRRVGHVRGSANTWTDAHRAEVGVRKSALKKNAVVLR